ncbi:MAG: hypothetical protein DRJ52_01335 [Thermoprotei archaeon]|nr:MAG: hypothetical protein DRJ52_01335 [Thermoprotei archaeon]
MSRKFAVLALIILLAFSQVELSLASSKLDYRKLKRFLSLIDFEEVVKHTEFFAKCRSRVPGYRGYYSAVSYITEYFKKLGISHILENFSVTAPFEEKAYIKVIETGEIIEAHALWPNMIVPPNFNGTGKLVYGGKGRLLEYSGSEVEGSIVLLDFNCRWYWINAFSLGAKAVIFIENESTLRHDAWLKVFYMPAHFPRLYVSKKDGLKLIKYAKNNYRVEVHCNMRWEEVEATNIIVTIPGSDTLLSREAVCIIAHLDSLSPVPAVAPGATEAYNLALVLELVKALVEFKPKRTVVFLITGAHGLALAGAREFVSAHFNELGTRIRLAIELDIDWTGKELAAQYYGLFYSLVSFVPGYESRFKWIRDRVLEYLSLIKEITGENSVVYDTLALTYFYYEPVPCFLDCEVFTLAGIPAFAFRTFYTFRPYLYTPYDTLEKADLSSAKMQAITALLLICCFLEDSDTMPSSNPVTAGVGYGFSYVRGRVYRYNRTKGWFKPVSAIVALPMWPYNLGILTDFNGSFIVKGARYSGYYWFLGFKLSKEGLVEAANEYGGLGPALPMLFGVSVYKDVSEVNLRITDCGGLIIINAYDPRFFVPGYLSYSVLNATHHTALISWGPQYWYWYSQTILLPAGTRVEVLVKRGLDVVAIINNASAESPLGTGYLVKKGRQILIKNFPLEAAETFSIILDHRINSTGVSSRRVKDYHLEAKRLVGRAKKLLKSREYGLAYASMMRAWAMEAHAYNSFHFLLGDTCFALIILVIVLFIASMRLKLFFSEKNNTVAFIFFTASMLIVVLSHPALRACSIGVFIVPSASVLLIVVVVVISLIRTFMEHVMKVKRRTPRFISKRASAEIAIFSLILAFSIFYSVNLTYVTHLSEAYVGKGSYRGIMLRTFPWKCLCEAEYDAFRSEVKSLGGYSSMRIWIYPHYGEVRVRNTTIVKAFLGVSVDEAKISGINSFIVKGRWFSSDYARECLISRFLSKFLNASVGDKVVIYGVKLKVVGVFDEDRLASFTDLDGEPITPRDIMIPRSEEIPVHVSPKYVVIIPAELAREMGGDIYSIAVAFEDDTLILRYARNLAYILDGAYVYCSIEGKVLIIAAHNALGFVVYRPKDLLLAFLSATAIVAVAFLEKKFFFSDALQASFVGGVAGYVIHLALGKLGLCELSVVTVAPLLSSISGFLPVLVAKGLAEKVKELKEVAIEAVPREYKIRVEVAPSKALEFIEEVAREVFTEEHGYLIKRWRRTGESFSVLVQILPRELFLFYRITFEPIIVDGETFILIEVVGRGLGARRIRRRIIPDMIKLLEAKIEEKLGGSLEE